MAVNQDDILAAEIGGGLRRGGDGASAVTQTIAQGAASFLNILDRVMLREYTEPSFAEAMAMKEAGGSADAQRAMALNTARQTPTSNPGAGGAG